MKLTKMQKQAIKMAENAKKSITAIYFEFYGGSCSYYVMLENEKDAEFYAEAFGSKLKGVNGMKDPYKYA